MQRSGSPDPKEFDQDLGIGRRKDSLNRRDVPPVMRCVPPVFVGSTCGKIDKHRKNHYTGLDILSYGTESFPRENPVGEG